MSIHRPTPRVEKPVCPGWARRLFLEDERPARDSPDHAPYAEMFLAKAERVLWEQHRDALLMEWVGDHPGTRPPGWWRLDAPELRRVPPGQGVVTDESAYYYTEGIPGVFPEARGQLVFVGKVKVESEAAYLRRLGLFLKGEARRVRAAAYRPKVVSFDLDPDV